MSALGDAAERAATARSNAEVALEALGDPRNDSTGYATAMALLAIDARLEMLTELLADFGTSQHPIHTDTRPTRPGW